MLPIRTPTTVQGSLRRRFVVEILKVVTWGSPLRLAAYKPPGVAW